MARQVWTPNPFITSPDLHLAASTCKDKPPELVSSAGAIALLQRKNGGDWFVAPSFSMKTCALLREAALLTCLVQMFWILIVEIIWKREMKVIIYLGGFITEALSGFNK